MQYIKTKRAKKMVEKYSEFQTQFFFSNIRLECKFAKGEGRGGGGRREKSALGYFWFGGCMEPKLLVDFAAARCRRQAGPSSAHVTHQA